MLLKKISARRTESNSVNIALTVMAGVEEGAITDGITDFHRQRNQEIIIQGLVKQRVT